MKLKETVRILDNGQDDVIHLPGSPDQFETLCGWVDVPHELLDIEDHPPDCTSCLNIWRYCKNLVLPADCPSEGE